MAYRRPGRARLMISEIISGGDPITPEDYCHLEHAVERGLNYLDMALPDYEKGGLPDRGPKTSTRPPGCGPHLVSVHGRKASSPDRERLPPP
jgi:hypothetical protein